MKPDGKIDVKIYRKPTHTDQYLHFSSNHPVQHKLGVIRTLYHRADTVITDPVDTTSEKEHIDNALIKCGYPKWAFDRVQQPKKRTPKNTKDSDNKSKGQVVIPYIKGTSEALRRIYGKYGIRTNQPTLYDNCLFPRKTKPKRRTLWAPCTGSPVRAKPLGVSVKTPTLEKPNAH